MRAFFLLLVFAIWAEGLHAQATPTPNCCQTTWTYPSGNTTFSSSTAGLAYDPSGPGTLYVGGVSVIQAVHPPTGSPLRVLPGTYDGISMMDVGQDGFLYVGTFNNPKVYKVQLPSGARAATFDISPNIELIFAVHAAPGGTDPDLYLGGDAGSVYKVTQSTGTSTKLVFSPDVPGGRGAIAGLLFQQGTLGAPSQTLYVADPLNHTSQILKFIQVAAGSVTYGYDTSITLGAGMIYPHQMTRDASGNIYLAGQDGYREYDKDFLVMLKSCSSSVPNVQSLARDPANGVYLGSALDNGALTRMGCVPPNETYPGFDPPSKGEGFVYPSPARGPQATLSCSMAEAGEVELKIWNKNGELVTQAKDHRSSGVQIMPFDISRFATGVYFYSVLLRYDSGNTEKLGTRKFAVIH